MTQRECEHAGRQLLFEYSPEPHDDFLVFYCPDCDQHVLLNGWERIDWEGGDDTQHMSWTVLSPEDLEEQRREARRWGRRDE